MLAHFSHHLLAALLTPLLPFIREEFALDYTKAGLVVSAFTLSYGISQLPAGWLADRLGYRILITLGISGAALFGLLTGLSSSFATLVISLVLLGISGGGYHPAAAPLVSASVSVKNQGRGLGLHQIGGTASFFLAPLIAVAIAAAWGWRGSFISLSLPIFIFGILFSVLLGRLKPVREEKESPAGPAVPFAVRRLAPLLALSVTIQVLVTSAISFIPLYFVDRFGISKEAASALLSLAYSSGFWAGPLGGYLSDRLGKTPLVIAAGLIVGPAIYLLGLASFGWSSYVLLIMMGAAMYSSMPVSEAFIVSHTQVHRRSTILGIYYFASRGGPGLLTLLMGYLIDHAGFSTTFSTMAVTMLAVALVCSIFLARDRGSRA